MDECKPLINGLTDKVETDNTTISGLSENITGLTADLKTAADQIRTNGITITGLTGELQTANEKIVSDNSTITGRGLHSSTFQLNLSALYGIRGARRGSVARVKGVSRGV